MNTDAEFTIFALRALADHIIVFGYRKSDEPASTPRQSYRLHWTGRDWEPFNAPNAYVFEYRATAEHYLDTEADTLAAKLPR